MKKYWTEEEEKKFIELYSSGLELLDISARLQRSFGSCWAKLKDLRARGIVPRDKKGAPGPENNGQVLADEILAEELSRRGYAVSKMTDDKMDREHVVCQKPEREFSFAVISCTHLGSRYQQLTLLREFYQRIFDQGILHVFHCGDLIDGMKVYDGQEYEIFAHGVEAQVNYAVEYYPRHPGLKTYVIAGNHDYSFIKYAGADALDMIAQKRKDIVYLGAYGAYPRLGRLKIYLHHGHGGTSYASSYRLQRNIERFSPQAKPDYYFLGHYHTTCALFQYRNVLGMLVPCFQSQTPYERRQALSPEIGGYIFHLGTNDVGRKNNLVVVRMEYVPFYRPIEDDY